MNGDSVNLTSDMTIYAGWVPYVFNGTYYIVNTSNKKYCLDVKGGNKSNGTNVQLWTCNKSNAQKWVLTNNSNGTVSLKNVNSGKNLSVQGNSASKNVNIYIYSVNSNNNQKWRIVKNGNGYNLFTALNNSYLVDIKGGTFSKGTNIQLWTSNNSNAQIWSFVSV